MCLSDPGEVRRRQRLASWNTIAAGLRNRDQNLEEQRLPAGAVVRGRASCGREEGEFGGVAERGRGRILGVGQVRVDLRWGFWLGWEMEM